MNQKPEISVAKTFIGKQETQIPVLVIACNRPTVARALDSILAARSKYNGEMFPILVSQDCGHAGTLEIIKDYTNKYDHIGYIEQKDRSEPWPNVKKNMLGYFKLSRHYKFALDSVFARFSKANGVIIVEDDLEVSPDFLNYFKTFSPLLFDKNENLYWNRVRYFKGDAHFCVEMFHTKKFSIYKASTQIFFSIYIFPHKYFN